MFEKTDATISPKPHPLGADRNPSVGGAVCGPDCRPGDRGLVEAAASTSHSLIALLQDMVPGAKIPLDALTAILDAVTAGAPELLEALKAKAQSILAGQRGTTVYYRGLLEFSNLCARNCHYCGIRAGNGEVSRFTLSLDEIAETARWCADNGYGSLTLQSGERQDAPFIDFVEQAILRVKAETRTPEQPEGLGITLCVGELDESALGRMKAAGAHRYLLRVETTNPELYAQLHPIADGGLAGRIANLRLLKRLGFQVGTGVMIGLPGQTSTDLAADLHFFYNEGVQMIGMGPYIPHHDTPLGEELGGGGGSPRPQGGEAGARGAANGPPDQSAGRAPLTPTLLADRTRFELGLAMVALARIMLPKANIAATTALQALHPFGRELGLDAGANILMPLVTPQRVREQYQLYDGKPCVDDELDECRDCLAARVSRTKRDVGYHQYGDSLVPVTEVDAPVATVPSRK